MHHVVCVHTYQEGQVRKPVVLGEKVNILLLSVQMQLQLILHLQMLIIHAISSLGNVLQRQIQEVVSEEIVGSHLISILHSKQQQHRVY